MRQPITKTQIRQNVVREAIDRATRDCLFLFVYEYKGSLSLTTLLGPLYSNTSSPRKIPYSYAPLTRTVSSTGKLTTTT